jgi:signal transduction histidine kinase/ActR/RegA family two-component response regulator
MRRGKPVLYPEVTDETLVDVSRDAEHLRILKALAPVSAMGVPILARDRLLGVITFMSAESGRRYGDAEVELAQDLAHRIALAIDNARLYRQLQEADRRKDEFLAMLAHELRNPLAPILNAMHVLRLRNAEDASLQRQTAVIERQVRHMSRLLDDLLDVSRITRGKIKLRKDPVDLSTVVEQAVETSRTLIEERRHALSVSLPVEPLRVEGDLTRLVQVVANLLNNAAKYTDPGGRIEVSAGREGDEAVIRVRDTGIGIAPEHLPHVFDLFTQADRAIDRAQGGLGIGLTMVQRLAQMHGGRVAAGSAGPGQGSEFVVCLPLLPDVPGATGAPLATSAERLRRPRRILVVDDNEDAARSLADLLELYAHQVEVVHDGASALEAVRVHRPEVVLLDIGLPGIDGYEVARRLRRQTDAASLLLVALSGYGQEEDQRRALEAGFDDHLTKPVEFEALDRLLAAVPKPRQP